MPIYDVNGNVLCDDSKTAFNVKNLNRRMTTAEKANDFTWNIFDKAYFVFIHDDTNAFLSEAYNAFHSESVPLGAATIIDRLNNTISGQNAKYWLNAIVADGGEVLSHYNYDLTDDTADNVWYENVVIPKITLEDNGYHVKGIIRANSTTKNSQKGEKFCREYYEYSDEMGTSTQYNLGRKLMLRFSGLSAFKAELDSAALVPGLHAYGFHGLRTDEQWITGTSLQEIIQYILSKDNTAITTYQHLFDTFGAHILDNR